ncbi:hypothetical protein MHYP_G00157300 [Metynnis hypsauchen]
MELRWRKRGRRDQSERQSKASVYVEFDDLEWEKREWVKVYEDFRIFLLEQQLVWAKGRRAHSCRRPVPSRSSGPLW